MIVIYGIWGRFYECLSQISQKKFAQQPIFESEMERGGGVGRNTNVNLCILHSILNSVSTHFCFRQYLSGLAKYVFDRFGEGMFLKFASFQPALPAPLLLQLTLCVHINSTAQHSALKI